MSARLAQIFRHPVKGIGREALDAVVLSPGAALPFDRHWAVAHEAAGELPEKGWAACMNFLRGASSPLLMAVSARLDDTGDRVTLSHPDRDTITVAPDDPADAERLLDWLRPLIPSGRAAPARVHRTGTALTDSAYPSVSILSLTANRILGQRMSRDLSIHRWRGNLWVEGLAPWEEFEWVGREITIGAVCLRVEEPITRCTATTANPETGRVDADTLGTLEEVWGHRDFGVYARVVAGGEMRVGDAVMVRT